MQHTHTHIYATVSLFTSISICNVSRLLANSTRVKYGTLKGVFKVCWEGLVWLNYSVPSSTLRIRRRELYRKSLVVSNNFWWNDKKLIFAFICHARMGNLLYALLSCLFFKATRKNLIKLLFANQNEPNSNTDNIVLIIHYRNIEISSVVRCVHWFLLCIPGVKLSLHCCLFRCSCCCAIDMIRE